jgi:hypothetical protein
MPYESELFDSLEPADAVNRRADSLQGWSANAREIRWRYLAGAHRLLANLPLWTDALFISPARLRYS